MKTFAHLSSMDRSLMIVVFLAFVVYFSNLGGNSIYILDEAKNAGCAMEMLDRGDAVVPTFNNKLRTDKPPLHYYFMIASYEVFGITPFAARFFSAVCGVLLVIVLYQNVKKLIDADTALFSALTMLSSVQVAVQFHLAVPDPYLILLMTISLFSFFNGYQNNPRSLKWFYVATALAFLTKGLIAIVLPGFIILLFLLITKQLNWSIFSRLKIVEGFLLFCLVALPWYVAVGVATDGIWLRGFFMEHNMDRYTSTMEGHGGFPLAPFVILCVALLPFSVFIVQAVKLALTEWRKNPILLFSMLVCLVIAGFFSLSKTILPSYPAPAIPFLALLLGNYLAHMSKAGYRNGVIVSIVLNFLIGILLLGCGYFVLNTDAQFKDISDIALIFIVLPIGSVIGWYFFKKGSVSGLIYAWSASWIVLILFFFYYAYPQLDKTNPITNSMPLIKQLQSTHQIVAYRIFNPAYVFNLKQTIEVAESPEQLKTMLHQSASTIVITRSTYLQELRMNTTLQVIYEGKDLFEDKKTVILAN